MTKRRMFRSSLPSIIVLGYLLAPGSAAAQAPTDEIAALRAELAQTRAMLVQQNRQLAEQQRRLDAMERRLTAPPATAAVAAAPAPRQLTDETRQLAGADAPSLQVGEPPADADRAPPVAVLDQQGSVVTRKGQLIAELGFDYTRSDRNRAIFRGVELIETVLVGVFDINENRQDILTASGSMRYGLTDRIEIGARLPFIYRSDKLVTTPIAGSTANPDAATIDSSVNGSGIGDLELSARYQINNGGHNVPFLIANLQAVIPTGRDPFSVRRDENGAARQASTGAGFWGITPSITAILPSEPAVLFGTLGYTFNMAKDISTRIPPVQIDRINPGDQINISAGVGLALNERTSMNFGYTHAWSFGTTTRTRVLDERSGEPSGQPIITRSRDLQIGRFLFGVSHRFSDRLQISWSSEIGATEDAPDVRTSLRIPFTF